MKKDSHAFKRSTATAQAEKRQSASTAAEQPVLSFVSLLEALPVHTSLMPPQQAWHALTEMRGMAQHLIMLAKQQIDCDQIGMIAISPPEEYLHTVAVSGFTPVEAQFLQERSGSHTLSDYFDADARASLHAGQVLLLPRTHIHIPSEYEGMMRDQNVLIAPLYARDCLSGILIVGKPSYANAYTQENFEIIKAIATLIMLALERLFVMHEWVKSQANEVALAETNRRMNSFISLTSHELNTPLTSLMGSLQLAQHRLQKCANGNIDPQQLIRCFERMQHGLRSAWLSAYQMKRLINHMIDDSLLQSGNLILHKQRSNLAELTRHIVEEVQYAHPQRVIRFSCAEQQAGYPVYIDETRIRDTLYCFLDNALGAPTFIHEEETGE
ncbi:hypothetical protein KSD_45310 [Ktedonobacter sp. SOSP1-85]|uniref:sensor histidine kinase n=1 Tax=Ktedonobacter sp. SOSP1-85 TaxID=2778367 RepID=UPI0019154105|nr:HAMP domain-containing histidine kinase [Ktedonobacter sp. SOSP1-85]GHO76760.1 hypothetical protein KSD_45310 [Ktedonobacter sp. SOSP1-85]